MTKHVKKSQSPMAPAEQFRRYASNCVRVALQMQNPADKASLLQMAKMWLSLAEQSEKYSGASGQIADKENNPDERDRKRRG